MGEPPTSRRQRPFDAVAADELQRDEILEQLTKALKAYFKSCSGYRDVDWDRVRELLAAACRAFYDSLATSYLGVEPPVDPEHLFGMNGELNGSLTFFDFKKAATRIKIRTPGHFQPPPWREGDSPEEHRESTRIFKSLNKFIRLGPYLEAGWLDQRISEGVKYWRPQFERQFATPLTHEKVNKTAMQPASVEQREGMLERDANTPEAQREARPADTAKSLTLDAALEETVKLAANARERKWFRVVTLYDWYLRELKKLKAQHGQRPRKLSERETLRQGFPYLEVWKVMDPEENDRIEKMDRKEFIPNKWALSLAAAHENLTSLSNRSVINYRNALKRARSAR